MACTVGSVMMRMLPHKALMAPAEAASPAVHLGGHHSRFHMTRQAHSPLHAATKALDDMLDVLNFAGAGRRCHDRG